MISIFLPKAPRLPAARPGAPPGTLSAPARSAWEKYGENDDEPWWTMTFWRWQILFSEEPIDTNQCHGVEQKEFYPALLENLKFLIAMFRPKCLRQSGCQHIPAHDTQTVFFIFGRPWLVSRQALQLHRWRMVRSQQSHRDLAKHKEREPVPCRKKSTTC